MQGRIYPSMIILLRLTEGDEIERTSPDRPFCLMNCVGRQQICAFRLLFTRRVEGTNMRFL